MYVNTSGWLTLKIYISSRFIYVQSLNKEFNKQYVQEFSSYPAVNTLHFGTQEQ